MIVVSISNDTDIRSKASVLHYRHQPNHKAKMQIKYILSAIMGMTVATALANPVAAPEVRLTE